MPVRSEFLQGTLELLVPKTLSLEPMHGWGTAQRIEQVAMGNLAVSQGPLYPVLQRLKRRDWIRSDWRSTANNRRARCYRLTRAGDRGLEVAAESWGRSSKAVNWALHAQGGLA